MSTYPTGTQVRITGYFTDFAGDPSSPTTVRLRVLDPDDVETTPTVVDNTNPTTGAAETGTYYADVLLTDAGDWCWRWESDGSIEAAGEGVIKAKVSKFTAPM